MNKILRCSICDLIWSDTHLQTRCGSIDATGKVELAKPVQR